MSAHNETNLRCFVAILGLSLGIALLAGRAYAGGGNVLPPTAQSHGFTLADLAEAVAPFTTSGNNPNFYPHTPFQILYVDPATQASIPVDGGIVVTGSNRFTVPAGTAFYVPIISADNAPPVLGEFPTDAQDAIPYFFDLDQLGAMGISIAVDGVETLVSEAYLVGPIEADLQNHGTQIITLGVFLTPMSVGTHTVTIRGGFFGALIAETLDLASLGEDFTYTVEVVPGPKPQAAVK